MSEREKIVIVTDGGDGRLDQVLTSALEREQSSLWHLSRSQIKKLIKQGSVYVNESIASKAGMLVAVGDEIHCEIPERESCLLEPFTYDLDIIHEEAEFLIVNKPAQLTVHPGTGTGNQTLLNALIARKAIDPSQFSSTSRPGIVHRLDKDTTGLLVVAKTQSALTALSEQFQSRTVEKRYITLAARKPRGGLPFDEQDQGIIEAPIGRHLTKRTLMAIVEGGRESLTEWRILQHLPHAVLLEISLHTGRTHQIRLHLEWIKSGVIGDTSYGVFTTLPEKYKRAAVSFGRQALHAAELVFSHPQTGKRCEFQAPLPTDFQNLIHVFSNEK